MTKAVLITSRRVLEYTNLKVGNCEIRTKDCIKYLGIMIDNRLSFKCHFDYIRNKTGNTCTSLHRIMPNTRGPKYLRRKVLAGVVKSTILYGAPIWAESARLKTYGRKINSIYRLTALRVCCAYRTVSDEAAFVIAAMMPIDILAMEAKYAYDLRGIPDGEIAIRNLQSDSIAEWQSRWSTSTKGRWTYTLIPNVNVWYNRKHGYINFYLTQFLSGHGCFRSYLYRFGLDTSPLCPRCVEREENAEHVFFYCPRFSSGRENLQQLLRSRVHPVKTYKVNNSPVFYTTTTTTPYNFTPNQPKKKETNIFAKIDSRKRKRLIQTTMKEMVGGCCVCSDERGWPENPLVYCDGQNCTVAVHQACYGIVTVPTGPWFCRKCESQERSTRVRCELCPSRDGALKKTDNQGWAHVVCALYIPEVRFGNVTTMEPIILQLIPQERYGKNCYICQELGKPHRATVGACMQCNKSNCKQQFHVTCAQSLGLLCEEAGNYLDNVKYCGYCQHHYSKLKKGGNVKTIPPYKPIAHDTSSDSGSSPEKEIDSTMSTTASSTSATSIKITTNLTSSTSSSSKQRKSSNATKQSSSSSSTNMNASNLSSSTSLHNLSNAGASGFSGSNSLPATGAGTNSSSSNLKSSTGSSSGSYKDGKDGKHSKNMNKISSSSKDKEKDSYSSSFSSSRDSRDKSSKSSKNKDSTSLSNSTNSLMNSNLAISSSSLNASNPFAADHSSGVQNLSTTNLSNSITYSHSNPAGNLHGTISSSSSSTSGGGNVKDSSKNPFSSATSQGQSTNFLSELHSDGTNLTPTPMDIISTGNSSNTTSNTHLTHSSSFNKTVNHSQSSLPANSSSHHNNSNSSVNLHINNTSNSSTSSFAKKRKNEAKLNAAADELNSPFRDIIKDVTVTLTPLTDFEKEIEKSSKKQKTELSPPTHQSLINAETSSQNSRDAVLISTTTSNTHSSSASSNTAGNQSSSSSSSSSHHKTNANNEGGKHATGSATSAGHKTVSTSSSITAKEREERYAAAQAAIAAANGGNVTASSTTSAATTTASATAGGNAPSLYVSVPLSTANVPGINLPTNSSTAGGEHTSSQTTRSTSQQQQQSSAAASSSSSSSAANNTLDRQSPFNATASSTTSIPSPANAQQQQHGVIYQSGKSPNSSSASSTTNNSSTSSSTAGINLTASTTETGNLKISYEKQSSRLSQIQEQETAPIRRSRTPDSGVFSSSSFNISNASSCSTSSLASAAGGGLKFSYEPQSNATNLPPSIDTTNSAVLTNIVKDSPPSSPGSEAGSQRKRGRKAKDSVASTSNTNVLMANDLKDIKLFQNGGVNAATTTSAAIAAAAAAVSSLAPACAASTTTTSSSINVSAAAHMLGNHINPNSSVAQKLSDQLSMEIQDHSVYSADPPAPQFMGVPFPGKMRTSTNTPAAPSTTVASTGPSPLASMFGSGANGNLAIPQSLEQLLERQWEQGSQFLMEQAQHFDIASLLSCLHQLQSENVRLEEHVSSLIARRDHLLAVNARLAIPLNTNTTQSQVTTAGGNNSSSTTTSSAIPASTSTINSTPTLTSASAATAASLATAATTSISGTTSSSTSRGTTGVGQTAVGNERMGRLTSSSTSSASSSLVGGGNSSNLENGLDFRQSSNSSTMSSSAMRHPASTSAASQQLVPASTAVAHNNSNNSGGGSNLSNMLPAMSSSSSLSHAVTAAASNMPPTTVSANRLQQQQQLNHMHHQHQQQQQHHQQHMQHVASAMHQPPPPSSSTSQQQQQQQQQTHHHSHLSSHPTAHATHAIHHEPHPMTTSRIGEPTKATKKINTKIETKRNNEYKKNSKQKTIKTISSWRNRKRKVH
ncbi:Protein AF-10 [Lucilia cuprina]|nr:Protein AF-10 [Lucilia cuprina]